MSYLTKDITDALKEARESKQLSQRALSKKVGLPQSHISRIENGVVDLQLSSLIELSRVLDFEVMLVPRKLVPAVQGLVRSAIPTPQEAQRAGQVTKELRRIHKTFAEIQRSHPGVEGLVSIQNVLKDLQSMPFADVELGRLHALRMELKRLSKEKEAHSRLRTVAEELQQLRNTLAHRALYPPADLSKSVPAYSLDEDNDHG